VSDTRKLVGLFLAVMALGVIAFGVVRGLSATGPASGTRMIVTGDQATLEKAVGTHGRVVPAGGDHFVVEVAQRDPQLESQLHVERSETFTRATGFLPRAWIFLAVAAVMLAGAALLLRKT
jgi:hypothetical protein